MKRLLVLLVFSVCSCHHFIKTPTESDVAGTYYQVKKGDTVKKIAAEQFVSEEEVADVNGVSSANTLRAGQWLFLPESDAIGARIRLVKRNAQKTAAKKAPVKSLPVKNSLPKKKAQREEPKIAAMSKPNPTAGIKSFRFPVHGGIVFKEFSLDKKKPYDGVGIRASLGTNVEACRDGEVLYVGNDGTSYGLMVILEHEEPYITVYTHLDKALVKNKARVKSGDVIGQVGRSGGASFPQLHFQLRVKERPVNPRPYFKIST